MENNERSSYRQILKTTGLFGGVQVISILISMVRTKFVAVLLGTEGVGIINLLNSPLSLISSVSGLGIGYSAVRDISKYARGGNMPELGRTVSSFKRLVIYSGSIGVLITLTLSPFISNWTFGSRHYTWAFIWLSITILINAVSGGQRAILQGVGQLKSMAKATTIGSLIGLATSIPLYYYFGVKGIVPAIMISSFSALFLSWYYAKQVPIIKAKVSTKDSFLEGRGFIKMGILFSISTQIGGFVRYLVITFISNVGGLNQVGLYSAGISFIGTSVGLIFTAMETDFYPKLAARSNDNNAVKILVNQQVIVSLLIIFPIVLFLLVSMPLITKLFLSAKFNEIIPFVNLTVIGVLIQAVSFSIGYISFSKGDSMFFFWMEGIFSNVLTLILYILGYKFLGLIGIGCAYISQYVIYLLVLYALIHKRYEFSFKNETYIVLVISILVSSLAYLSIKYTSSYLLIILESTFFVISILYSLRELNKRMDLRPFIIDFLNIHLKRNDPALNSHSEQRKIN